MNLAAFILAEGMSTWGPETWTAFIVGTFIALLTAKNQWDMRQAKRRIEATDTRANTAQAVAQQANQEIGTVKAAVQVADAKAEIANTRVGNVAQVANAARSDVTRIAASMPAQPWYPAPPEGSGESNQSSGQ